MYNGVLHPCYKYTIRGFIWYQGESDVRSSRTYAERLTTVVKHWRSVWKQGDLLLYYAGAALFVCEYKEDGCIGALLREAQQKVLSLIPNSDMIRANDLAETYKAPQVHPHNKKGIGERPAYMSLNKTYRYQGIELEHPSYKNMKINGETIKISFSHAEKGLSPWMNISGSKIVGSDEAFYSVETSSNQKDHTVVVKSPTVKSPVAARCCFRNFLKGNLINTRNLSVGPLRTDKW